MFFKRAFKYTENLFFKKNNKKKRISKKEKNYQKYYAYYFQEVSVLKNISMSNFYHPQKNPNNGKKSSKMTPGLKSFNQVYIDIILLSEKFRKDVKVYLENNFRGELEEDRKQKIYKFLKKC